MVLVPVKAFGEAKRRLGPTLDHAQRVSLARAMADRVIEAAAPLPVAVVCDDTEVAAWARAHRALVVWEPGRGLNGAVEAGVNPVS
jgi:2-phospho-L-lactate guanylyltransferase